MPSYIFVFYPHGLLSLLEFGNRLLVYMQATDSRDLSHSIRFVCVEVLRPSQSDWVMSSAVSLPNHTLTGQA